MDDSQESGRALRRSRFGRSSSAHGSISCQRYDVGRARATKRSRHGAFFPCIDAIAAAHGDHQARTRTRRDRQPRVGPSVNLTRSAIVNDLL
jgi:hypothetical protein